jgi:hypothetical protein
MNTSSATVADEPPFAVIAIKPDGRRTLFGRYQKAQAEQTATALHRLGMAAEVAHADGLPERPGEAVDVPVDENPTS